MSEYKNKILDLILINYKYIFLLILILYYFVEKIRATVIDW